MRQIKPAEPDALELADVDALQPVNRLSDLRRADAGYHHAVDILDIETVFTREFAESAVNARDRVRGADEHRFYQIFLAVKAHDLSRAAAYIYSYDNAQFNYLTVFIPDFTT